VVIAPTRKNPAVNFAAVSELVEEVFSGLENAVRVVQDHTAGFGEEELAAPSLKEFVPQLSL
jgi:hypothetical protein